MLSNELLEDEEVEAQLINEFACNYSQVQQMFKVKLSTNTLSYGISILRELVQFLPNGKGLMQPLGGNLQLSDAVAKLGRKHSANFTGEIFEELPYYGEVLGSSCIKFKSSDANIVKFGRVSNPTVHVALNQLRKVHNDIIDMFGCKPEQINIEMVRELKKGNAEIAEINKEIAKNNKQREEWRKQIKAECNVDASDGDLAKMKLWCELDVAPNGRICIFTGEIIRLTQLISSEIEIEHILPRSLTMDDSAANLTVTFATFNRLKRNQPPEKLFATPVHWGGEQITHAQVIARAESLKASKSWRFAEGAMKVFENKAKKILLQGEMVDTELEGFAARHLVDTSHIAKLAKKYLAYSCEGGERNVISTSGTLTGLLRNSWGWNTLIAEVDKKDRTDHRHHAIDGLVIALTTRSMVQRMAIAAKASEQTGKKLGACVAELGNPWAHYDRNHLQTKVDSIIISHKPDRGSPAQNGKTNLKTTTGQLHDDTYYGIVSATSTKKDYGIYVVRKSPAFFETIDKIEQIRDAKLQSDMLEAAAGLNDKKAIIAATLAFCEQRNIRGIRVLAQKSNGGMVAVKHPQTNQPYKFMVGGSNFCAEIFTQSTGKNAGKWQAEIIKTFDANQAGFIPKWRTLHDAKLIMRLQIDDMVAYEKQGKMIVARVRKMGSNGQLFFVPHNVTSPARTDKETEGVVAGTLQQRNLRKISVSPAGRVQPPLHSPTTNKGA